ncbi:MAG: hypothetical protein R2873_34520 [Caldilineaceae bacterium]
MTGAIRFSPGSDDSSIIEHMMIRFGGNEGYYGGDEFGAIRLDNALPTLRDINTFNNNYINGLTFPVAHGQPTPGTTQMSSTTSAIT